MIIICCRQGVVCRQEGGGYVVCEPVCYVTGIAVCTIAVPSARVSLRTGICVCPIIHWPSVNAILVCSLPGVVLL